MILDDTEVQSRIESPMNLLNRLKTSLSSSNKSSHPSIPSNSNNSSELRIPSIPPTADQIVDDLEDKLKTKNLKSKAVNIINECLDELAGKVSELKPERLATVAAEMNKIVVSEADNNKDKSNQPQVIYYCPTFIKEDHFETVYARE
jgi:hypothetical protein